MKTVLRELPVIPAACCAPVAARPLRSKEAADLAVVFKALADPHRVRILNLLGSSSDPMCVCDFMAPLDLSQGTVSFHLKKLLDAGLLEREQRGTWAYYSLRRESLERLAEAFVPRGEST